MTEPEDAAQLDDDELLNEVSSAIPVVRRRVSLSTPALMLGMFALPTSWFTPWVAPLALAAVVLAVIALMRGHADRSMAWWGFGLGIAALVGCSVWAVWILAQLGETPVLAVPGLR
ncbi:hypothetical protein QWJ90_11605 [Microbacterium oryzae]|uniref:hypothetical protein n=1 Tax=Microbacterium oryzae TaxID=743009 RepID=UPI0025B03E60|nr:hypothetical protein [Microbacterium oryzae]MDN3311577.1 hypothetical protein [Microbacterium oryzae]